MRMSLMFAAVTLLTGINLFFIPFQPVPALWGAILAVAFVLINVVADKLRLWSGIAWIIVAGIIITLMLKGKEPGDELRGLITVFAGTVAKLAMRQPFVLFKGLTFQKLCLPGAFRPGDHHNKMLRPGLCVVHASPQYL
ncbi:putative alcohol dehydrogenase class III [Klebsiella pneumoniae]|nr:putative alcohol dehydrogenase class III [Klebsiella pneumoniae]